MNRAPQAADAELPPWTAALGYGGWLPFAAVWLYEHRVLGDAMLSRAYVHLRRRLTIGVLVILVLALFGPVQRLTAP